MTPTDCTINSRRATGHLSGERPTVIACRARITRSSAGVAGRQANSTAAQYRRLVGGSRPARPGSGRISRTPRISAPAGMAESARVQSPVSRSAGLGTADPSGGRGGGGHPYLIRVIFLDVVPAGDRVGRLAAVAGSPGYLPCHRRPRVRGLRPRLPRHAPHGALLHQCSGSRRCRAELAYRLALAGLLRQAPTAVGRRTT